MAVNLQVKESKRKVSELEDITNSNTYYNKKMRSSKARNKFATQQRSPSPTDTSTSSSASTTPSSSSPPRLRSKSVTFASGTQGHGCTHKNYEESPLLTPKDEEDDYEEEEEVKPQHVDQLQQQLEVLVHPEDLDHNTDYIALSLTLRLLYSSKTSISNQIVHLSKLLDFHRNSSNKADIINLVVKLINNELNLPKQNKIIQCPKIEWSKYHQGLSNVNEECFQNDEKPFFRTLHMFDK